MPPAPLPGEPEIKPQIQPTPAGPTPTSYTPPPPPPPSPPSPPSRFEPPATGPSIPPSPPPEIGIRTMASDLSSFKSSGGLEAKPKTFKPEEFSKEPTFEPQSSYEAEGAKISKPKPRSRVLPISLGIIGFVIIAGLVLYFFVLPIFFPKEEAPVIETENPPAEQPQVEITPLIHQTFFITPPASSTTMNLNNLNLAEVDSALNAAASGISPQTIREVTFTVAQVVPEAADFMSLAFPELDKEFLKSNFNRDFTVFLYRDSNGSWPGYVFRLDSAANASQVTTVIKTIESSVNIPNLFLSDPGAPSSAGFKDGIMIGEAQARYLSYGMPGASLNYGWFNDHLIVSTSFNGLKESLKLMGFSSE